MTDDYDVLLEKLSEEVERLARDLRVLRGQRVIRVINVQAGDWTPPIEHVHTCGNSCQPATKDQVGICEVTEAEIEKAHRKAKRHLEHLERFFPLPNTED